MLARVALDPNVLSEDLDRDRARMYAAHRELVRVLERHGVVVQEDQDQMWHLIQEMPQNLKKLWLEAFKKIYREVAPPPSPLGIGHIETEADLDAHWGNKTRVAVVERLRAIALGVPDDAACRDTPGGVEVVRFDLVHDSATFQLLESLSESGIPPNTERSRVWRDRFHLLSVSAEFVVIFDRYAGKELLEQRNDSGLYWLLQKMDGCRKTKIHVLTGVGPSDDTNAVKRTFEQMATRLRQGGIREIKVTLAPDEIFQRHAHDRHIRFDHHAFNLSKGVSVFSKSRTDQGYLLSRFDYGSAVSREKTVRDNAVLRDHVIATNGTTKHMASRPASLVTAPDCRSS